MRNGEHRKKVQENIYEIVSNRIEQNNETAMLLSTVAGAFLDCFLVNLRAELEEKKKIELANQGIQNPEEFIQKNDLNTPQMFNNEFNKIKATPNYRIINTNNISDTLKRMNFEHIASKIEAESIEINFKIRDECFAAVRKLPFVSTDEHFMLARDLIASGIMTDPDEVKNSMEKKKPVILKTKSKLKKKKKKDNFFF